MDHQVPSWLADTVMAAGMTTVYNAEDWIRTSDPAANRADAANDDGISSTLN